MNEQLEEFGATLVKWVRDAAVRSCDNLLQPQSKNRKALRWKRDPSAAAAIAEVVPDAVDETIFRLLHAIDEGLLHLKLVTADGREIDLTEAGHGELAGWYLGGDGWREKLAKERFIDDVAALRDE